MLTDMELLREFATRYAAAWCSQNAASVAAFFSPEGSLRINDGAPSVGRAAITKAAQDFMTAFPDMRVVMDDVRVKGNRIEFHWTLIGTNNGTGSEEHRVRIGGFESWQIGADGLIAVSIGSFDGAEYQRQLEQGVS